MIGLVLGPMARKHNMAREHVWSNSSHHTRKQKIYIKKDYDTIVSFGDMPPMTQRLSSRSVLVSFCFLIGHHDQDSLGKGWKEGFIWASCSRGRESFTITTAIIGAGAQWGAHILKPQAGSERGGAGNGQSSPRPPHLQPRPPVMYFFQKSHTP